MEKTFPFISSHRALTCMMVALSSSLLVGNVAYAQEQPKPQPQQAQVPQKEAVLALDLRAEVALKSNVSFEVKQRPLRDLLADLQQQSGIQLNLAPDPKLEAALVTARVKELPLSTVMESLGQLYGTSWTKDSDNKYQMASNLSPIDASIASLGDLRWFRYWRAPARNQAAPKDLNLEELADWTDEIFNDIPRAALLAKGEVPLTVLSPDLRLRLRHQMEDQVAIKLLRTLKGISTQQLKQGSLTVVISEPERPNNPALAKVQVRSSPGFPTTDLFSFPVQQK